MDGTLLPSSEYPSVYAIADRKMDNDILVEEFQYTDRYNVNEYVPDDFLVNDDDPIIYETQVVPSPSSTEVEPSLLSFMSTASTLTDTYSTPPRRRSVRQRERNQRRIEEYATICGGVQDGHRKRRRVIDSEEEDVILDSEEVDVILDSKEGSEMIVSGDEEMIASGDEEMIVSTEVELVRHNENGMVVRRNEDGLESEDGITMLADDEGGSASDHEVVTLTGNELDNRRTNSTSIVALAANEESHPNHQGEGRNEHTGYSHQEQVLSPILHRIPIICADSNNDPRVSAHDLSNQLLYQHPLVGETIRLHMDAIIPETPLREKRSRMELERTIVKRFSRFV